MQLLRSYGVAILTVACCGTSPVLSAELPSSNLEGTWKWTFTMPDGTKVNPKAKLKLDGNAISGKSMLSPGTEVEITDGKVTGDEVTWFVVREHGGRKVITRYSGKLVADTLTGTIQSDWTGEKRSYPWQAKRASDLPTGTWRWEFSFGRGGGGGGGGGRGGRGGGGARFESRVVLKYEEGKLTGKMRGRTSDTEISHGKFENGVVSFEVERERFGVVTVTKYWGKIDGDTLKGKSEFEFGEELRTVDWEATRVEE